MNKSKRKWYFLVVLGLLLMLSLILAVIMIVISMNFYYLLIPFTLAILVVNRGMSWTKWVQKDVKKVIEELE